MHDGWIAFFYQDHCVISIDVSVDVMIYLKLNQEGVTFWQACNISSWPKKKHPEMFAREVRSGELANIHRLVVRSQLSKSLLGVAYHTISFCQLCDRQTHVLVDGH